MNSQRGQIFPLAMVMVLLMAFFWVMLLNIGKLIKDRIQMQVAADTAAQSVSAYRARGLNIVGVLNSWLGVPIVGIGTPQASWWPALPHTRDARTTKQSIEDLKKMVKEAQKYASADPKADAQAFLKGILRGLMSMISLSYDTHDEMAQNQKEFIETVVDVQERYVKSYGGGFAQFKGREIAQAQGVDDVYLPTGQLSFGLIRDKGLIWYLETLHIWYAAYPIPVVTAPYLPINDDEGPAKRWYKRGPNFYRQSLRLYVYRRPSSKLNGPFPLGRTLFNIQMPYLYTVAAARVYNPDGPMFPSDQDTAGILGGTAAKFFYDRASNGWSSQLSPIGGLYEH